MTTNPILLTGMSAVDGLHFRKPYGEQDAEALAAVHAGRAARDAVDPLSTQEGIPTVEFFRAALAQAASTQQVDRWLVAEVNRQVVGHGMIESWHEEDERWIYLIRGWVLPEWRGRGIGTAILHWGEDKARQIAAIEHPGERLEFAANASSTEHIQQIAESIAESYRNEFPNHRFRSSHTETAAQAAWHSNPVFDRALWQIAWGGDQVAGQVLPMIERGRAVIDEVNVRPAWRRRGLARALLTRALRDLRSRGMAAIRIATWAEFPTRARDLYTNLGFRVVKEFPRYRKSPV